MRRRFQLWFLLLLLVVSAVFLSHTLRRQSILRGMNCFQEEDMIFRSMRMSEQTFEQLAILCDNTFFDIGQILPLFLPETNGDFSGLPAVLSEKECMKRQKFFLSYAPKAYSRLCTSYSAVWNDLEYFPVAGEGIRYENTWMFERNYGGRRGHEGTDLIPPENLTGYYPVISITDGTVEKIGWLDQGGYRIGIRSPSGGYFYYAHLDSYEKAFQIGEQVTAGQILGRMGDSGYGPEGTTGKFVVHLHLGIYIRTAKTEELSINPYWILRYLEQKRGESFDRISQNASLHLQG